MRNPFNKLFFIEINTVICPLKQKLKNCIPPIGSTNPPHYDRFASMTGLCVSASRKGIFMGYY